MIQQVIASDDFFIPSIMEDNLTAFDIFRSCGTQWRFSMSGVTGLDYTAVINVIKMKVKKKQRERVFDDIQLLETGALQQINRRKNG